MIDELRLSIFGAVQPEPLSEMLNLGDGDHQGFWDRFLLIPAEKVSIISQWKLFFAISRVSGSLC